VAASPVAASRAESFPLRRPGSSTPVTAQANREVEQEKRNFGGNPRVDVVRRLSLLIGYMPHAPMSCKQYVRVRPSPARVMGHTFLLWGQCRPAWGKRWVCVSHLLCCGVLCRANEKYSAGEGGGDTQARTSRQQQG